MIRENWMSLVEKEPKILEKINTVFTASVSEQKEHFMLSSSSSSLIPHLQTTLQASGPRRFREGRGGGQVKVLGGA